LFFPALRTRAGKLHRLSARKSSFVVNILFILSDKGLDRINRIVQDGLVLVLFLKREV
jgi:hypothetical protein